MTDNITAAREAKISVERMAYHDRFCVQINKVSICALYGGKPTGSPVTFTFRADANKASFIAEQCVKIATTSLQAQVDALTRDLERVRKKRWVASKAARSNAAGIRSLTADLARYKAALESWPCAHCGGSGSYFARGGDNPVEGQFLTCKFCDGTRTDPRALQALKDQTMDNTKALDALELKPCPFCGSNDVAQGASRDQISVWCSCGAEGPKVEFPEIGDPSPPIDECFRLWNCRDALTGAQPVAWRVKFQDGLYVTYGCYEAAHQAARAELPHYTLTPEPLYTSPPISPVPVKIDCPVCGAAHIDEGEWATRPHKTHQCQNCMHEWRPFPYATVGILATNLAELSWLDDLLFFNGKEIGGAAFTDNYFQFELMGEWNQTLYNSLSAARTALETAARQWLSLSNSADQRAQQDLTVGDVSVPASAKQGVSHYLRMAFMTAVSDPQRGPYVEIRFKHLHDMQNCHGALLCIKHKTEWVLDAAAKEWDEKQSPSDTVQVSREDDDKARMDWLVTQVVEVRTPLRSVSRADFITSPIDDDGEDLPSHLRELIDDRLASQLKGGE